MNTQKPWYKQIPNISLIELSKIIFTFYLH